jgi:hypothetical protein
LLGFGFHHQHGGFGTGNHQIHLRGFQLRTVGFRMYWPLA